MFREMKRRKQLLSHADAASALERGSNGILACLGDEDYPYAVPLSYAYHDNKIYFHSAKSGHKIDAITANDRVSFAVIEKDEIVSIEYTSYFRSVVVFGRARIAEGDERVAGFRALVSKYCSDRPETETEHEIADCMGALIIAIDIDHMTGKQAIELAESNLADSD